MSVDVFKPLPIPGTTHANPDDAQSVGEVAGQRAVDPTGPRRGPAGGQPLRHAFVGIDGDAALEGVDWLRSRFPERPRTVLLCGPGNNGGDGLAIARHLASHGWNCRCCLLGPIEKLSTDARHNANILLSGGSQTVQLFDPSGAAEVTEYCGQAALIIDAMLGTGAKGNPRSPLADWIVAANASPAYRLAIDIPTGVDADTGRLAVPTFRADATLTFVARKPSMLLDQASRIFGDIQVLPIGLPEALIGELLMGQDRPESSR